MIAASVPAPAVRRSRFRRPRPTRMASGLGNVYLRRRTRGGATFVPLLGPAASGRFRADGDGATWEGSFDELDYTCTLRLHPTAPTWFWSVEVINRTGRRLSFDVVLAQDLGLAHEGVVRSSEAYTSQYIDHAVLRAGDLGVVLCSRQNMPQDGAVPWIMHGCLDGAAGFLTDGVQLYGLQLQGDERAGGSRAADPAEPRLPVRARAPHDPVSQRPASGRCDRAASPSSQHSRLTTRRPRAQRTSPGRFARRRPSRASPGSCTASSRGPGFGRPGCSIRR